MKTDSIIILLIAIPQLLLYHSKHIVHTFDIYQCFYLFHLNSNGKIQFVRIEQHGYDR